MNKIKLELYLFKTKNGEKYILNKIDFNLRDNIFSFIFWKTIQSTSRFFEDRSVITSVAPISLAIENNLGFGIIE